MKNKTKTNYLLGFLLSTFLIIGIINVTNGITIDTNPDISKLHTPSIFSLFLGNSSNSVEMSVATGSNNLDILNGLIVGKNNKVTGSAKLSVIGGGSGNQISASYAGIGGGQNNTINKGENGAIGGGYSNKIGTSNNAKNGVIAGGRNNHDDGGGIILGGKYNKIGSLNKGGVILGGQGNSAGPQSLVLGSATTQNPRAGEYSFIWNQKRTTDIDFQASINAENGMLIGTYNPITGVSLVVSGATKIGRTFDLTRDGKINIADDVYYHGHCVGQGGFECDLNGDGTGNTADEVALYNFINIKHVGGTSIKKGGIDINGSGCIQFYDGNVYNTLGKTSENNDYCGINTGCQFGAYTLHNGDIATGYSVSYTGNCQNASDNVTCTNGKMIDKNGKSDKYIYPYCYDLSPNPMIVVNEGYQQCRNLPKNAEWTNPYFHQNGNTYTTEPAAKYDLEGKEQCAYKCNDNYTYDETSKTCVAKCTGQAPSNTDSHVKKSTSYPSQPKDWSYITGANSSTLQACQWTCDSDYERDGNGCKKITTQPICGVNSNERFFDSTFTKCTNGTLDGNVTTKIEKIGNKYQAKRSWSCKNDYETISCSTLRPTANFYITYHDSGFTFKVEKDVTWNADAVNFNGVTGYLQGFNDKAQQLYEYNKDQNIELSKHEHSVGIKFKSNTDSYKLIIPGETVEMSNQNGVRYGTECRTRTGVKSNKCENPTLTDNLFWVKDGYVIVGNNMLSDKNINVAYLLPGLEINGKMTSLVGGNLTSDGRYAKHTNFTLRMLNKIKSIEYYNENIPSDVDAKDISLSGTPVYIWFNEDNGTIYYHSDATKIYLNEDSRGIFYELSLTKNITFDDRLDTSKVKDMQDMFNGCGVSSLDFSKGNWDTSNVRNMAQMFAYTDFKKLDLSHWNTSSVTNMNMMFYNNYDLESLNVSGWNTSNVTNMSQMFQDCRGLTSLDLSSWNTSSVTNMRGMFAYTYSLEELDLSHWNTSSVTNMSEMFWGTNLTSIDVSSFNTNKVTNMKYMFNSNNNQNNKLTTIYASENFVTSGVTDSSYMFTDSTKLQGGAGTTYSGSHIDKEYARVDCGPDSTTPGYFTSKDGTSSCTQNVTYLKTGSEVNQILDDIDGNPNIPKFNYFKMYTGNSIPSGVTTSIISMEGYTPVYVWHDRAELLYYTEASKIYLNPDSSHMFDGFYALRKIDTTKWDTSNVTDMSYMFEDCKNLTSLDVSNWDTSNVKNMRRMFAVCQSLTELDLSGWNTSSVTDMGQMFNMDEQLSCARNCSKLTTLNVSGWNTSNVKYMDFMFNSADHLKDIIGISEWNTSKVTNMDRMFHYAFKNEDKILDLSKWNVSNVESMDAMFGHVMLKELNISGWNTSKVKDMSSLFYISSIDNLNASNLKTQNVTNMEEMFYKTIIENLDVSGWDTSKVQYMGGMFQDSTALTTLDLSSWNTSNVTDMGNMFAGDLNLTTVYASKNFKTNNVTSSDRMFTGARNLVGLKGTKVSEKKIYDKTYAKLDCGPSAPGYFSSKTSYSCNNNTSEAYLTGGITINRYMGEIANNNLSNIQHFKMYTGNTNNIPSDTDTRTRIISTDDSPYKVKMWYDENSSTIYYYTEADIIYLNPYSSQMFENVLNVQDIDTLKWNTSKVKTMKRMFFRCTKLTNLNVSNWNTSSVEDMSFMFNYCYKLTNLNVSNWVTSSVENMQSMFDDCYGLTNLNVSNWNTSNVKNMSAMFDSCTSLTTLDLSSFITLNVDDMSDMFNNCQNLKNLNISFDTSNVTKLSGMFKNCNSLTSVNVGNWVTSKVDDMNNMFNGCNSLTNIDVSNWDTSNVENMQSMFEGCSSLTNLDVSNWNVNNVHNFHSMFEGCSSLTKLDVSKWKILPNNSQIQPTMEYMFSGGANLICLDISNWGGRIEDARIQGMFSNCENLKTIFARPFWDNGDVFNRYSADNSKNMFLGDINLVGGAGTTYNKNNVNASYARIDVLPNFPGYFTSKNTNDPGCDSIQLMNEAYLISGSDINYYMRELAGKTISNIQHFKMYTGNPDNISSDIEIISTEDSPNEVIMWYDDSDKTIYYYSDADIIYMNPDSSSMFEDLENLTDISGISKLNTSKVTDMSYMFYRCTKLQTLDLSNFDTSNVQNMKGMFSECSNLKYLDLSNFDTHNVINMSEMFNSCSSLTGLDLSNFDTRIVKNMNFMFSNCTNLVKIYASYKFTTDHTDYINQTAQNDYVSSIRMFSGDTSLIGGNGTKFNSSHVDKEYARLDCRDRPGYFSSKNGYSCIFNGRCGSEPYTCESGIPNFNWYGYSDGSDYVAGYDEIITGYKRDCIGIGGGTSEIGCTACPEQYCYYDRGGLYYSSNTGCHYQITNYYNNNKNCSIVWDNGFISSYGANCNWIDSPAMSNECKKRNYDYNGHITQFGGYTEHFNSLYPSRVEYKPLDHFVCGSSALFTNIPTADPSSRWRLINQCTNTVSREYYPYS